MKKIILFTAFVIIALLAISCGGHKSDKSFHKQGQTVYFSKDAFGAVDKESFDKMIKYCNREDEKGLVIMEAQGLIRVMEYGESGVITELGFGETKVRLEDGSEYWYPSEMVE